MTRRILGAALGMMVAGYAASIGVEESALAKDHPLRQKPVIDQAPQDALPRAELLSTPSVRVLLGYTRRPLHLPDGHTVAYFSFGSAAPANWVFLVDARDISFKRCAMPNNDVASHGAALGRDGFLYFMPYATARAYRLDPKSGAFEQLPTDVPAGEYSWDALGGSNGRIYFGTYPSAYFGEYDPVAKAWFLKKDLAPDAKYVTNFSEDPDGKIRFNAWGPTDTWMTFDPQTRAFTKVEPPEAGPPPPPLPAPEGDDSLGAPVAVQGRRFAVGHPSGRLWEVPENGAPVLRGDLGIPAEPSWWLEAAGDAVAGVSYFGGLFRYDLKTGEMKHGQLDNLCPGGNGIMFLASVTPRCVIGANYSQQNLFKIDPETGAVDSSPTVVARTGGEPMCAVGFGGKAYVGIYTGSILSIYDPDKPFEFRKNPREIAELRSKYTQTRPRDAATDGKSVFISSDSEYKALGGALAVIDPKSEHVDVYHHLIPDQNLPTLAYDPVTKLLWGGTDRWGQMRSHPPTQPSALIYAFDPDKRELVAKLALWPDADVVAVHGVSRSGILVASSGNEIALIDTKSREVLYRGESPLGVPSKVVLGHDGSSYCLVNGALYRWDFERNRLAPVGAAPGCIFLTTPAAGLWLLTDGKSVYRLRLKP